MRTRPIQSSSDPVSADAASVTPSAGGHTSVLLHEAIAFLEIKGGDVVVDGTLGGAGHARDIVSHLDASGTFIGFDLDADAIERAALVLNDAKCRVELIQANFRTVEASLESRGIHHVDKALFDLGWSGFQLSAGRGFSFGADEPLTMTYTKEIGPTTLTAAKIVNTWREESIADIIFGWGEERLSRKIARAIVSRREIRPFDISLDLAEVIRDALPKGKSRIHPATKTFQALRIAVNDELGSLKDGIEGAWKLLRPGGRIAVIAFHSIEDRIVKHMFAEYEKSGAGKRLTKKPFFPSFEESHKNPRARSAKLRVVEKI
jgi:16S rRNA (cytosine1402-N4)-methyltransferase